MQKNKVQTLKSTGVGVAVSIQRREDFKTRGALSASWLYYPPGYGRLNTSERIALDLSWVYGEGIYVVFSYETPIAWWTDRGGWHKVDQKFSRTTSKHQSNLYLI